MDCGVLIVFVGVKRSEMYLSRGQMLAGMGKKFYKERVLTEKRKVDDFKACRLGDHPQVARAAPVSAVPAGTETKGAAGSSIGNTKRKR